VYLVADYVSHVSQSAESGLLSCFPLSYMMCLTCAHWSQNRKLKTSSSFVLYKLKTSRNVFPCKLLILILFIRFKKCSLDRVAPKLHAVDSGASLLESIVAAPNEPAETIKLLRHYFRIARLLPILSELVRPLCRTSADLFPRLLSLP
jgi:hypothetical protein